MLNIVKIELRGFKSFADKVEIPFKEGITAVIGPNGCGKSNVADAIRWTLGERSAKGLRAKSMTDVIFNGTEKRKGMSYCEVSLTFDNTDQRIFPGLAFDEVVFTRKLDRSGKSEYFINGNRCPLRDINSLLHDTGIGKEGYSIIGQGRVQEIMSAKPEDRRQIFEEAAGISKFRFERDEAEKKLDKTKENLKTINEVIAEIEKQIKPLEKQAEQAQKYYELKEQLKYLELNHYVHQFESNQKLKISLNNRLNDCENKLKENDSTFTDKSKQYDDLMNESSNLDKELETVNNQLLTLKVDETKFQGDIALFNQKLESLQTTKNNLDDDLRELDTRITDNQKSIDSQIEAKNSKFQEYLTQSKQLDEAKKKYEFLSQSADDQEKKLMDSNRDFIAAMNQLESLRANQGSYLEQQGIYSQRIQNLNEIIDLKDQELNSAKTEFSIQEGKINTIKNRMKELSEIYNNALATKKEANESIGAYQEDIGKFTEKLYGFKAAYELQVKIKNEYAGYQDSVKRLMQDSKTNEMVADRVWGVLAEVIDVPEKYTTAVEYALGGNMQNILVETERDAADLITYLKQKGYGRVTFRPATSARPAMLEPEFRRILDEPGVEGLASNLITYEDKYDCFIQALLGATVVVNNIDNATTLYKKYNRMVKIVTLEGDVFTRGGEITGGSRRGQTSSLLSQEKTIEQIKENIDRYEKRIADAQDQLKEVNADIEKATKDQEEASQEIASLRTSLQTAVEVRDKEKEKMDRIEGELKINNDDIESVKGELQNIQNQLSSMKELEELSTSKRTEYEQLLNAQQSSSEDQDKKNERAQANRVYMDEQVKNSQLKQELDYCDQELSKLYSAKDSFATDKIELVGEIKKVQVEIDNLTKSPEKTNFTEEDKKKIEELSDKKDSLTTRKNTITGEIKELDTQKTSLLEEKNNIIESKTRNQNILENLENTMLNLQQYFLEEYDMTYQLCLEQKDEAFEDYGSVGKIQDIKKEINRLGDINPLALRDLEQARLRHEEQSVQRDDIQKAYDDIITIIKELTTEMETKFITAFDQINENFKVVFAQLFGGGKGELRLDKSETDDVLECGIQIMAQPPGKKLISIQQMSGGEQTLTAISILFAILKLKPMPFCLLDEIEAALDDDNANSFATFLKKFSDYTQFIVITHRKPTMSHADTIFGVTMQEKGVTKMVSVEFEDALKQLSEEE